MRRSDMRRFRLGLALVALGGGLVWLVPVPAAFACSCSSPGPFDREVRRAGAVFAGTPVGSEDSVGWADRLFGYSSGDPIDWTFEVDTVIKGDLKVETHVSAARDGGSCGVSFRPGRRYVVFAYEEGEGDALSTNLCTRTSRVPDDRVFEGVGARGFPPGLVLEDSAPWWPWILVPAALVAGAVGVVLLRRRARRG